MTVLRFPDQATIQRYLDCDHPVTKGLDYLKDQQVTEAAARHFANQSFHEKGIGIQTSIMLYETDFGKALQGLSRNQLTITIMALTEALIDCAKNNTP